jgi:hypothetical protein
MEGLKKGGSGTGVSLKALITGWVSIYGGPARVSTPPGAVFFYSDDDAL